MSKLISFKPFFTIVFFVAANYAYAQNNDSLVFVKAKWVQNKVAPKTKSFLYHFKEKNLFFSNQNISYIEVKNKSNANRFAIGFEEKILKTTSAFGRENGAIVAINGTFFDVKNGGSVDFIKVNRDIITQNRLDKSNNRAKHQQAAVVISEGKLQLKKWDGSEMWEKTLLEEDVMVSGPLLIIDKRDQLLDSVPFNTLRHPRSAIGIKPNGKIILLTVDGRHDNSAGMSLFELTKIMRWLGCISAINLDGGGSTTLWLANANENGVINYPSDNKKWDHDGERKVANVILLKKRK